MKRPLCEAGEALVAWLEANEKSQQWLADKLQIGRAVLWRWLVGETTPHIDSAAEIEQLTGIPSRLWAKNPAFRTGAPLVDVPDDSGSEAA